jgi:hypothetical protein|tara:strand:+ start:801 stop:986 length:186 start_codon:yes stop_codon:yes gene_type:complete
MKTGYSHSGRLISEPHYYFDDESARDAGEVNWEYVAVLYCKESWGEESFYLLQELGEVVAH